MIESPIPLRELEASFADPDNPTYFPPQAYTSPAFYAFEVEAIWRREWVMVGRLEEIERPGDYFAIDVAGENLLVVRQEDGSVSAMSSVCRHRGMVIAEGRGTCDRAFICAYHGWAYNRAGRLLGAPQEPQRARQGIALPQVRTEVWKGFIFVNFDQDAAPLAPRLAPLEAVVAPYGLENLRGEFQADPDYKFEHHYPWNWKVYNDGQNECYHCDKLHGDTPVMQNSDCNSLTFGVTDPDNGVFEFTLRTHEIDVTLNHLGKTVFGAIPTLTEEQRWESHTLAIMPGVLLVLMSDSVIALAYAPTGPTTMRSKRHRLYPAEVVARPDFLERHRPEYQATREFVSQDDRAFERVQLGLASNFAPRGPIANRERILVGTNRWLMDRYRAAALAPSGKCGR
ncbi:aromatic ring-hydroxylating oxygenase subunit alpha [Streptomyces puniciscabiei]